VTRPFVGVAEFGTDSLTIVTVVKLFSLPKRLASMLAGTTVVTEMHDDPAGQLPPSSGLPQPNNDSVARSIAIA